MQFPWQNKRNRINRERRRQHVPVSFVDRLIRVGLPVFGVMTLVLMGVFAWSLIHSEKGFLITRVEVFGADRHVTSDHVIRLLQLKPDETLLFANLERMSSRVLLHPWVKHVRIERELPQTLVVTVVEEEPIAIVSITDYFYVNRDGVLFKKIESSDSMDFPMIVLPKNIATNEKASAMLDEMIDFLSKYEQTRFAREFGVSEVFVRDLGLSLFTKRGQLQIEFSYGNQSRSSLGELEDELLKLDLYYPQVMQGGAQLKYLDLRVRGRIVASAM